MTDFHDQTIAVEDVRSGEAQTHAAMVRANAFARSAP